MLGAMYWLGFFTIVCAVALAFMIYHCVHHLSIDTGDACCMSVMSIGMLGFGIPLVMCLLNMHDPVKVTITEVDGTVTELTTERYLVSDGDNRYRIYNKDDDNWVEYHNVKRATLEYLEK